MTTDDDRVQPAIRNVNAGPDTVPIDSVRPHPDNPKQGDIPAIVGSIEQNGWFGRLIVQKSTGFILAGNHKWQARKRAGADDVDIEWVDVDDATARRILLADNRIAELGGYDATTLTKLLAEASSTDTLAGTGWDADDLDDWLALLERDQPLTTEQMEESVEDMRDKVKAARHRIMIDATPELIERFNGTPGDENVDRLVWLLDREDRMARYEAALGYLSDPASYAGTNADVEYVVSIADSALHPADPEVEPEPEPDNSPSGVTKRVFGE